MNFYLLRLHRHTLFYCVLGIILTITLTFSVGDLKPFSSFDWPDLLGEGGIAAITLIWIFFILISRPTGRVTNLLVTGLMLLHISMLLDLLDEFLVYPAEQAWLTAYEAAPAPIGMVMMTIALFQWHKEQLVLNSQLNRRERDIREHSRSDFVTGLYSADYMLHQIQQELELSCSKQQHFCLLMLDIDNFDRFVRQYGDPNADRLLREVASLLLMNIRVGDLACRYAGDRFIVLLPNTRYCDAIKLADQIEGSISHLAFKPDLSVNSENILSKPVYHSVSTSVADSCYLPDAELLLNQLNVEMEAIKARKAERKVA